MIINSFRYAFVSTLPFSNTKCTIKILMLYLLIFILKAKEPSVYKLYDQGFVLKKIFLGHDINFISF